MAKTLIHYDAADDSGYGGHFDADRFVSMDKVPPADWDGPTKNENGDPLTFVHLDTGKTIATRTSMRTLAARLQSGDS